jgi:hypothetical protein
MRIQLEDQKREGQFKEEIEGRITAIGNNVQPSKEAITERMNVNSGIDNVEDERG